MRADSRSFYMAEFSDVKPGQVVKVSLARVRSDKKSAAGKDDEDKAKKDKEDGDNSKSKAKTSWSALGEVSGRVLQVRSQSGADKRINPKKPDGKGNKSREEGGS